MKTFSLILFSFINYTFAIAQKELLGFDVIDKWPNIDNVSISNDGQYLIYNVSSPKAGTTLVVQGTSNPWMMELKDASNAVITEDSRRIVLKTTTDSLEIVELKTGQSQLLDQILSFQLFGLESDQGIAYRTKSTTTKLVLYDLNTGKTSGYQHVKDYAISENGKKLLLHQSSLQNNFNEDSVNFLDITTGLKHFTWRGNGILCLAMDKTGAQVTFLNRNRFPNNHFNLWYYKIGLDSAKVLVNDATSGMRGFTVAPSPSTFTADGENLFFRTESIPNQREQDSSATADKNLVVWTYQDDLLPDSAQKPEQTFEAVVNLKNPTHVIKIETQTGDNSFSGIDNCYFNDQILLITNLIGSDMEYAWRASARPNLFLVSTITGQRKLLAKDCIVQWGMAGFSPTGKFVWWFDKTRQNWFTYNQATGIIRNISIQIPVPITENEAENANYPSPEGLAGWVNDDSHILIYDKYDIWQLDPTGNTHPIMITGSYGREHKIKLRYLNPNPNHQLVPTFSPHDSVMLYIFDEVSKANGFAKIYLGQNKAPTILAKAQINYYGLPNQAFETEPSDGFILKAKHANTFVFRPNRDTMYPNLSITNDLIHFQDVTHFSPQKKYNWYKTELVRWKQPDGIINDGILYKPENFDPKNKYPLIVYVYETFSDVLNRYITPVLSSGDLIIPWYTSHDYLIFIPDIHYVLGHPGRSAFNSVSSAIRYMSTKPWVNTRRLGLQGHSFGGYETNYIVTRTNVFSAASSADGVCDWTAFLGQENSQSGTHSFVEVDQPRIGASLWTRPDFYIAESPIFKANNVNTPLLIVHNPLDQIVYLSQGLEWFTSLRRLGKKVWMLQYTNEGHSIRQEENKLSYTIHLAEFFDHFLKDSPASSWMNSAQDRTLLTVK